MGEISSSNAYMVWGEVLYKNEIESEDIPIRVYAPVGGYKDLLAYLVRRLLENAANSSFCLLYTSPSPRDQRGSRMPSSA